MSELEKLKAEVKRLKQFEVAYKEWSDKTDWVQRTAKGKEWGMHRADVLKARIEALQGLVGEVYRAFDSGPDHPWIPGFNAKPLYSKVKAAVESFS